ncbi:MAG: L-2-amino-thiazoline-4-carboxylic acid hydrolase [Promethearchaeota archaeon]
MDDQIKNKILQIRENWRNSSLLVELLAEWDEKYSKYNDEIEDFLGPQLKKTWQEIAGKESSHTVKDLVRLLLKDFHDAEYEMEEIEDGIRIITLKCPIAEVYSSINRQNYGQLFHCFGDPYVCQGFNPKIKYEKKKSLMSGDEHCEHYYLQKQE